MIAVIGFGFDVVTVARPAMLAARYDTTGYATISGIRTVPLAIATAYGLARHAATPTPPCDSSAETSPVSPVGNGDSRSG